MPYKDRNKALEYKRKYNKINYEKYKDIIVERNRVRRTRIYEWFRNFKKALKCSKCSESDWICLDFHHKNPKDKTCSVNEMVRNTYSIEKIIKEIKKCIILCSNCHRKLERDIRQRHQ